MSWDRLWYNFIMEKFPQPEQNKDFFAKREAQRKERDKETLDELQKTLPNESQEHLEQIFKEGEALTKERFFLRRLHGNDDQAPPLKRSNGDIGTRSVNRAGLRFILGSGGFVVK